MKIEMQLAKKLYPEAPAWFQRELEDSFGKKYFRKRDFTEIKCFEDACEELGISTEQFSGVETSDEEAYKKLKIVIQAINQGWTPDWTNSNEKKWWPYFNLSSGFGFSCTYYYYDYPGSYVGSRLCFESQEKAAYAGRQFLNLYKEFLT
jgi:hypothetical protein